MQLCYLTELWTLNLWGLFTKSTLIGMKRDGTCSVIMKLF